MLPGAFLVVALTTGYRIADRFFARRFVNTTKPLRGPHGKFTSRRSHLVITLLIGILVALFVGFGCRAANLPLPAPPTFRGALLVAAMTSGYLLGGLI
jgi:XapX domain-containing protein